jgi:HEAT repeat protein
VIPGHNDKFYKEAYQDLYRDTVEALGKIGDVRAVDPLVVVLRNFDEIALECFSRYGRAGSVIEIGDFSRKVKRAAAEALGKIGDARAVDSLVVVLKNATDDVYAAAATALGKIGDTQGIELLLDSLIKLQPR